VKLILIGAGGHAAVVADVARSAGFDLIGVVSPEGSTSSLDLPRLGDDSWFAQTSADPDTAAHLAFAPSPRRAILFNRLRTEGRNLAPLVAARATVSPTAELGHGVLVVMGAVVNAKARIGDNSIINTSAIVEHETIIGPQCHVAPGAILCGGVTVGEGVTIGAGAVILPGLRIASNVVVGAGAVVCRSIDGEGVVVRGQPARILP
jgi:UDP-perosamine 4-acetyltransferase